MSNLCFWICVLIINCAILCNEVSETHSIKDSLTSYARKQEANGNTVNMHKFHPFLKNVVLSEDMVSLLHSLKRTKRLTHHGLRKKAQTKFRVDNYRRSTLRDRLKHRIPAVNINDIEGVDFSRNGKSIFTSNRLRRKKRVVHHGLKRKPSGNKARFTNSEFTTTEKIPEIDVHYMKTPVRSRKHHSGSPLFVKKKEETPFGAVAKKLIQECTDMPELSANHEDFGPVPKLNFDSQNYLTGNYRKLILKRDVSSSSTNVINQTVTTSTTSLTSSPGNNATTEFLVPTTMAYQFIETPGMKDFTRSADSTDGVSETASNESCDREVPCNMGDTLEEILQAVDEIAHEKSSKTAHEDFPCDVNGSWVTEAGGVRLDIYVGNNSQLRIAQYETIPLKTHPGFLCNDTWVLNGSLPLSNSGIIMITGVNAHDKRVATFVGECRAYAKDLQIIWGHWITGEPTKANFESVLTHQVFFDIFVKLKRRVTTTSSTTITTTTLSTSASTSTFSTPTTNNSTTPSPTNATSTSTVTSSEATTNTLTSTLSSNNTSPNTSTSSTNTSTNTTTSSANISTNTTTTTTGASTVTTTTTTTTSSANISTNTTTTTTGASTVTTTTTTTTSTKSNNLMTTSIPSTTPTVVNTIASVISNTPSTCRTPEFVVCTCENIEHKSVSATENTAPMKNSPTPTGRQRTTEYIFSTDVITLPTFPTRERYDVTVPDVVKGLTVNLEKCIEDYLSKTNLILPTNQPIELLLANKSIFELPTVQPRPSFQEKDHDTKNLRKQFVEDSLLFNDIDATTAAPISTTAQNTMLLFNNFMQAEMTTNVPGVHFEVQKVTEHSVTPFAWSLNTKKELFTANVTDLRARAAMSPFIGKLVSSASNQYIDNPQQTVLVSNLGPAADAIATRNMLPTEAFTTPFPLTVITPLSATDKFIGAITTPPPNAVSAVAMSLTSDQPTIRNILQDGIENTMLASPLPLITIFPTSTEDLHKLEIYPTVVDPNKYYPTASPPKLPTYLTADPSKLINYLTDNPNNPISDTTKINYPTIDANKLTNYVNNLTAVEPSKMANYPTIVVDPNKYYPTASPPKLPTYLTVDPSKLINYLTDNPNDPISDTTKINYPTIVSNKLTNYVNNLTAVEPSKMANYPTIVGPPNYLPTGTNSLANYSTVGPGNMYVSPHSASLSYTGENKINSEGTTSKILLFAPSPSNLPFNPTTLFANMSYKTESHARYLKDFPLLLPKENAPIFRIKRHEP